MMEGQDWRRPTGWLCVCKAVPGAVRLMSQQAGTCENQGKKKDESNTWRRCDLKFNLIVEVVMVEDVP